MTETQQFSVALPPVLRVAAGEDRFGEHRGLGISTIDFKVSPQDEDGLLILENTFRRRTRDCGGLMAWSCWGHL